MIKEIDHNERARIIKDLISHAGWQYVEKWIDQQLEFAGNLSSIKTKKEFSNEVIIRDLVARQARRTQLCNFRNFIKNLSKENKDATRRRNDDG